MEIKKIKKAIIFCIILLIILMLIYFSKNNIAIRHNEKINELEKDYSEYIMPLNRTELTDKYNGRLSTETLYTLIYEFSKDVLPEFRNSLEKDSEKYFYKNKKYIFIKTGIENYETYSNLIKKISKLSNNLELSKMKIKESSVKSMNGYVEAILEIYYNDNSEMVEITINVENKENSDRSSIKFY